ncbi:MAG: hypothetical protein P8077_08185, partial [Gammaproteobacteria bacterium]
LLHQFHVFLFGFARVRCLLNLQALDSLAGVPDDIAFDEIDASTSLERQQLCFGKIYELVERSYDFSDKDEARDYFTRFTGLFKNLNGFTCSNRRRKRALSPSRLQLRQALTNATRQPAKPSTPFIPNDCFTTRHS